jgi:alpha-beta hydrolase superfamily lysophospholipase
VSDRAPVAGRKRRWLRALALSALAAAALLNVLAWRHAHALTHFAPGGEKTRPPVTLTQKVGVLLAGPTVPRPRNLRTPASQGLAFERHLFSGEGGPSLEGWLVPHPQARALVVLFHGHADSKQSLLPAARAFHDLGYATFLVDFRGSGGSAGDQTSIGFHEADDVRAAFAYASTLPGARPVVLYGNSMGAASVLKAMSDAPLRPAALVLECPFDRLATTVRHRFDTYRAPAFPAADLLLFWGGVQQGFNPWRFNPSEYAAAVSAPTLLMNGDRDPWVSVAEARSIYDRLRGPRQLKVFAGLGHQSFLRARREDWLATVGPFTRAHLGGGAFAMRARSGSGRAASGACRHFVASPPNPQGPRS